MESVCSLLTSISENAFWSIADQWALNPQLLMKPVKIYQIVSKTYFNAEGVSFLTTTFNHSNEEINGIPHDKEVAKVLYKRHLIPRLKDKDNEIDEMVELDFITKTLKFYPLFPSAPEPSYLPFFYPKVLDFTIKYQPLAASEISNTTQEDKPTPVEQTNNETIIKKSTDEKKGKKPAKKTMKIEEPPKPNIANLALSATFFDTQLFRNTMAKVGTEVLSKMTKWGSRTDTGGYTKHAHYDQIVPRHLYLEVYERIKKNHRHWADKEGDASDEEEGKDGNDQKDEKDETDEKDEKDEKEKEKKTKGKKGGLWRDAHGGLDPQKYVYEEIGIAAYLIALWEIENKEKGTDKKQSFVDVGCGNGFLVNILLLEGYPGYGIDLRSRKIWALYSPEVKEKLVEEAIMPEGAIYEVDWVVANHSDELTPWVPFIASKTPNARFFVIPCCFYDFGCKFNKNDTRIGQYKTYLNYVEKLSQQCGFEVERETLRIPSTKNVALMGRKRTENDQEKLDKERQKLLSDSGYSGFTPRAKVQPWVPPKRIKPDKLHTIKKDKTTMPEDN